MADSCVRRIRRHIRNRGLRNISGICIYFICRVKACVYWREIIRLSSRPSSLNFAFYYVLQCCREQMGEMSHSSLMILIFSLSLCRCTVTELPYICLSGFLCTPLLLIVLAMKSILLAFVPSRMPSRNTRKQHTLTVVCCFHGIAL